MAHATPLRVVQLSDTHLFADPSRTMLGLAPQESLAAVLALIRAEQPRLDVLLATGDFSQDNSVASYQRLYEQLAAFGVPMYWLEGNHDKPAPLLAALAEQPNILAPLVVHHGPWSFILLNSTIPGSTEGQLYANDLDFLRHALAQCEGQHVMVCLHHQPVPVGCRWLDKHQIGAATEFFHILDGYNNVRAVVWGHVHQEFASERNGVQLYGVPSTCIQFKPGCDDFTVDFVPPGYRWFDLHADGRIDTQVSRVARHFDIDVTANDY